MIARTYKSIMPLNIHSYNKLFAVFQAIELFMAIVMFMLGSNFGHGNLDSEIP